jgi:ABC-type transporter Mla MlaB component
VCWVYRDPAAWPAVAVAFLQDGIVGHDLLVYVADKRKGKLVADLVELPDRDELLASGQLMVLPLADAYVTDGAGVDAEAQVQRFAAMSATAVADGYRSLRLVADVTSLAASREEGDRFVSYEVLVDAMGARAPWTSLCGYDRDRVGERTARAACFVHPVHRDVGEPVSGRFHAGEAGQWCLAGEVDSSTREALWLALATVPRDSQVHIDVSGLRHIDTADVRLLAALASAAGPAGGVVLLRPPDLLRWMLDTIGELPGIEVRS